MEWVGRTLVTRRSKQVMLMVLEGDAKEGIETDGGEVSKTTNTVSE